VPSFPEQQERRHIYRPCVAIAAQPRQSFFGVRFPLWVLQRAQQIVWLLLRFLPSRDRDFR